MPLKLPSVLPLKENYLCSSKEEFAEIIEETIKASGAGAFFKILGKVGGKAYYATMLIDDRKILAVEVRDVDSGETLVGELGLELLKSMLESGPVIVDTFPLGDVDVKMSVVDNIDVYNATPKMSLDEMCPLVQQSWEKTSREPPVVAPSVKETSAKEKPKKKLRLAINAPRDLEPYLRPFGNRVAKYAKSLGVNVSSLTIEAKEVRYALGAGVGVHVNVTIEGDLNSSSNPRRIREEVESFLYREAAELSDELGKKVVISHVKVKV